MSTKLESIQVLRGAAASLVLLWHLEMVRVGIPSADLSHPPAFLQFGYAGVELFFVLSGYIIMHITAGRVFDWRDFLLRRAARIYPAYAAFTLITFIGLQFSPRAGPGAALDRAGILASFAILPQWKAPIFGPGWTLEHELIFYAIAGLLLAAGRRRWIIPTLCVAGSIGVLLHGVGPLLGYPDPWDWHLFSPFQLGFAAGAAVHEQRDRLRRFGSLAPLLVGCALTGLCSVLLAPMHTVGVWEASGASLLLEALGHTVASALILAALVNAEVCGSVDLRRTALRWLSRIGDASYILYLFNYAFLAAQLRLLLRLDLPGSALLPVMITSVVICISASLAAHAWIERPFLARVSAVLSRRLPRPSARARESLPEPRRDAAQAAARSARRTR